MANLSYNLIMQQYSVYVRFSYCCHGKNIGHLHKYFMQMVSCSCHPSCKWTVELLPPVGRKASGFTHLFGYAEHNSESHHFHTNPLYPLHLFNLKFLEARCVNTGHKLRVQMLSFVPFCSFFLITLGK